MTEHDRNIYLHYTKDRETLFEDDRWKIELINDELKLSYKVYDKDNNEYLGYCDIPTETTPVGTLKIVLELAKQLEATKQRYENSLSEMKKMYERR